MKLCIFSGTFNPIHNGHIRMAEYILKNFDIKKILFIPAFISPQKENSPELIKHRYNMVDLAIKNNPDFEISDIEYKRGGKSYTFLTVQELYKTSEIEDKINFVIGTDAFENLDSWYESEKLRKIIDFMVFVRKNDFDESRYDEMKARGYNFRYAGMPFNDISSTNIRERVKHNQSIEGLVPQAVERYIKEHEIYKY